MAAITYETAQTHEIAAGSSLQGELVQLIASQARRVWLPQLLSSALMAGLFLNHLPISTVALWWSIAAVAIVVRMWLLKRLAADPAMTADKKLHRAMIYFMASGTAQASALAFFPFVPVAIGSVISLYVVGACIGTLSGTAGYSRIYVPYSAITMIPVAVAWAFAGFEASLYERAIFVGITAVYSMVLLEHARGTYRVFAESFQIRLHRVDLIQQLSTALSSAESASRAKTRFLASASHDLRQPIHALSLFAGALQSRPLDLRTSSIASQIHKAVTALASQMDALLDISRLDAGVIQASFAAVEINPLLLQLADEFSPQAEHKGLRFTVTGADMPLVRTDPVLLQRVLRNLISNAIKYTTAGGVDIGIERRGSLVRVSVCDTGPGIAPAYRELIFEEFYQLDNPERDRTKGLGLGLAIVRRLTNLLGIALTFESSVGWGSTFAVDIPMALSRDVPVPEPAAEPAASAQHMQILVIDDEETIRVGMKMLFDELGFNVYLATSTEGALAAAQRIRPDIVLADLRLRGNDTGLHAIAALRALWPGLPALLISGDIAPDRLRQARDAGIELLHKPVNAELLGQTILRMTTGNRE